MRRPWKSRSGKFGKTNVNEIISLVRSFGIARGELVMVDGSLGVTMTEIVKEDDL